jgi:hypothetical protein
VCVSGGAYSGAPQWRSAVIAMVLGIGASYTLLLDR